MNEEMLPVAILAGGLATRLAPLTTDLPKALLDVNGEPFIAHQLRLLRAHAITRVVVCAGYRGERVQAFLGDGTRFGVQVTFTFDHPCLLGTAGAIKNALPLLGDAFFVLYGDSYLPCDYRAVQSAFPSSGKLALMTVFRNEGKWDRSNIEFADGEIMVYDKQNQSPRMRHIDYGLGVFARAAFDFVPAGEPYDLADVYQYWLKQKQLAALEIGERFYEIGSREGLEETRRYLSVASEKRE
jgi:NDP-sugar pyrophosphorylase family protein